METRICAICHEQKSLSDFAKSTQRKSGYGSYCKPCDNKRKKDWKENNLEHSKEWARKYSLEWKKDNPDKVREYERRTDLKRKYGLTIEEYDYLLELQGGVCAICLRRPDEIEVGRNFPVDHSHITGKVRGILCGPCNRGLGQLGDSVERVLRAAAYLKGEV